MTLEEVHKRKAALKAEVEGLQEEALDQYLSGFKKAYDHIHSPLGIRHFLHARRLITNLCG